MLIKNVKLLIPLRKYSGLNVLQHLWLMPKRLSSVLCCTTLNYYCPSNYWFNLNSYKPGIVANYHHQYCYIIYAHSHLIPNFRLKFSAYFPYLKQKSCFLRHFHSMMPFFLLCPKNMPVTSYLQILHYSKKLNEIRQRETHFESGVTKDKTFWDSRQELLKDINEAKVKVKEKVDEIIERENIWTVPNFLCISRIAFSPYLCYCVLSTDYTFALGLFMFAGFTDLIDGMIARGFPSQASRLGSFLDPLADKILIASLFFTLTYIGLIPLLLTVVIIYRDVLIIFGASYVRYKSLPPPHTISRYFDATHATAQLAPTLISKINTAVQLTLITTSLAAPVFAFTDHYLLHSLWWLTAVTTISSGLSYIFSKNTYKMLDKNKAVSSKNK